MEEERRKGALKGLREWVVGDVVLLRGLCWVRSVGVVGCWGGVKEPMNGVGEVQGERGDV